MAATATKNAQVLTFNDLVFFVPKESQVVSSLFKAPTTASGTFKARKNGIMFYDLKGHERVFLVANNNSDNFFVSCRHSVGAGGKKRISYMFDITNTDALWLLVSSLSYSDRVFLARRLWAEANAPTVTNC
jgi:hypothetical protein